MQQVVGAANNLSVSLFLPKAPLIKDDVIDCSSKRGVVIMSPQHLATGNLK